MKYIITESQRKFFIRENSEHIGKVYFNDEKHPGFMYVIEILPAYKMYWVGTRSNDVIPTLLKKDDELDIYWLTSPDGVEFAYEIFEKNGYLILDLLYPHEMNEYIRNGGEWFPSEYDGN